MLLSFGRRRWWIEYVIRLHKRQRSNKELRQDIIDRLTLGSYTHLQISVDAQAHDSFEGAWQLMAIDGNARTSAQLI